MTYIIRLGFRSLHLAIVCTILVAYKSEAKEREKATTKHLGFIGTFFYVLHRRSSLVSAGKTLSI